MAPGHLVQDVWVAQLTCQGALAVVLLFKRFWREFPVFTAYVLFGFCEGVTKYLTYRYFSQDPKLYFVVFWAGETIAIILGLAVVYEVFRHLFHVHSALRRLAKFSFGVAIVVLLGLGCVVVWRSPNAIQGLPAGVMLAEESARILELGLLMFLFLFSGAFGLHWRQPVFGVSLGLGIFVAVELTIVAIRSRFGIGAADMISIIRMLTYNSSLLLWMGYILAPERALGLADIPDRAQLEQWNEAIMELIHQ